MVTIIKSLTLAAMLIAFTHFNAAAQYEQNSNRTTRFSIEIDPATFVFQGYSAHLRYQPPKSDHILIGVGVYSMDIPSELVDFNNNNKDKGWEVQLKQGYGLFGEYYFSEVNNKWFVGGQVGLQEYEIEKESVKGEEQFSNILLMTYLGYAWHPFNFNLYLKPWAGIGYSTKVSGNNEIGNEEYDISPITVFATFHVGYTF